ncbi:MAG: Fe-S cluster assembly ATPase SufC [Bacilli bacterium]|jgi:Fe-S cluster assembly ATP-binding protein|nr:Fe-S cluster assembly ATPase SufC [Bacilli bacterium]
MHTLKIEHLTVEVENKTILKDFNLEIKSGEIHAIMGPNGTGKSTLSKVIMGYPGYHVLEGSITYDETIINDLSVDKRAKLGLFLGMQMPLEIEGVTNADFLRSALNEKEKDNFHLMNFIKKLDATVDSLDMEKEMIHRGVNVGFSGGERKKNEILQMYMLEPTCVLLDEIDSGLDVDSLRIVGNHVMEYFKKEEPAVLLITHYQRLLEYIKPTHIHIMIDGSIVKSGNYELVKEIETFGYDKFKKNRTHVIEEMKTHE